MPKKIPDLIIGTQYGDWTLLNEIARNHEKYYLCRCACGIEKPVSKSNLRLGKSKSCNKGACKSLATTHGKTNHPLYSVWQGIKSRLADPTGNNECYAGVLMCPEWQDFTAFYDWAINAGYSEGLSIDRIESNGMYSPSNCRWVDATVQAQNRRGHRKAEIAYKGVFRAKPRNGEVKYKGTGKSPYYYIVTYKGKRYQDWGYSSPEAAYRAKCKFIEENFKGLVYP